uniref:phosphoglycerate dehydrogenase n=1 Tax=Flavobacterium sp. TaxID=239 RepID=UPI00404A7B8F
MKVLITCPPMLRQIENFRKTFEQNGIEIITPEVVQVLSEEELIKIVPDVDGWIIGDDPATKKVFTEAKKGKLKAAVKWGVGVDNVDFNACKELNIPISNTPNMFGGEVADLAVGYLIGLARESYFIDKEVRKGNWVKPSGISISGKTIAVIGLGDIGRQTVNRLKGFNVKILGYDPFVDNSLDALRDVHFLPLDDIFMRSDFIILTCALTESSKHLINAKSISKMKDGVRLINVSRGPLINENDLIIALLSGKVHSAALDVFEVEPLSKNSELLKLDKCIFGTHNGSNTIEAVSRASIKAIDILFNYLGIN